MKVPKSRKKVIDQVKLRDLLVFYVSLRGLKRYLR